MAALKSKLEAEALSAPSYELMEETDESMARMLSRLINSSPAVVIFWQGNERKKLDSASENVNQFGYDAALLKSGKVAFDDMVHPEDLEYVHAHFMDLIDKRKDSVSFEYRLYDISGDIRWVSETVVCHKSKSDLNYASIIIDITSRKEAEKTLLEKERDIAILYSASSLASESLDVDDLLDEVLMEMGDLLDIRAGGVYIIDHESREAVLRAYIGPHDEYPEKIHYSVVENLFKGSADIPSRPLVAEEIVNVGGEIQKRKHLLFHLHSKEHIMGFVQLTIPIEHEISKPSLQVLEHVGKHIGVAIENAQLFEVTQRAYEDLKSLDKLKNEFLANLTHELKTPLISIKGFSKLLDDGRFGELNEEQKKANSAVVRNSERLKRLIDSLLYISLEKEGNYKYSFENLDVNDVVNDAMEIVKIHTEGKDIKIIPSIPETLSPIYGDKERLTTMIVNILDNSIKFIHNEGQVKVTVKEEENDIHIKIKDNGIGIPKSKIPRVFDIFYQIDGSTTRSYNGIGLGLHICKKIAEVHNGSVWVKSLEGFGTTTHIRLPK
ncbi:PAS domain S-box-containing protein [Methanohalophilus levihalophilus]|uniref:sensor histidine kinase n=1 Tax=Methanohalophilus levihalophilus TaxID=1431282 RepID=UPI001AE47DFA|nr:HAMP domain-containing sensor histidine kinase [Methanohalophilus levihalophilus]MBP2029683.1 PAS domain S-box-containing protein [Methanohalophilus levihalophilus]